MMHRNHYVPAYIYLHRRQADLCARAVWDHGYAANKTKFDVRKKAGLIYKRRDEALEAEMKWVEGWLGGGAGGDGAEALAVAVDGDGAEAEVGVNVVNKGKGKARAVDDAMLEDPAAEEEDGGIECQCCFADYPFVRDISLFCTAGCDEHWSCVFTDSSSQFPRRKWFSAPKRTSSAPAASKPTPQRSSRRRPPRSYACTPLAVHCPSPSASSSARCPSL